MGNMPGPVGATAGGLDPHSDPTKSQSLPAPLQPPVVEKAWLWDRTRKAMHAPRAGLQSPSPSPSFPQTSALAPRN